MPILNLGQIASTASTFAGGRADWALSEASAYVNIAVSGYVGQAAGIQHSTKEALAVSSTTSGGNRIAFPADYDYALGLTVGIPNSWSTATSRITTWEPMRKFDGNWADTFSGNLDGGEPEAYAEYATWLELVPSPDSRYSLNLRYMTKAPTLVASTDTPVLDEQWHWAVVLKTAELLAGSRDDSERELMNRNRYIEYVNILRTDQAKKLLDKRGARVAYVRKLR
jgi:hypothetical protein